MRRDKTPTCTSAEPVSVPCLWCSRTILPLSVLESMRDKDTTRVRRKTRELDERSFLKRQVRSFRNLERSRKRTYNKRRMNSIQKYLSEYLNYLEIEKNRSPKTRENYERYLRAFIAEGGISKPADITDDAVRRFRIALARRPHMKKITQAYYVIAIRNFLKYLAKRDVSAMTAEKIELPKIT